MTHHVLRLSSSYSTSSLFPNGSHHFFCASFRAVCAHVPSLTAVHHIFESLLINLDFSGSRLCGQQAPGVFLLNAGMKGAWVCSVRTELRPPCFHSKHVSNGVIFLALLPLLDHNQSLALKKGLREQFLRPRPNLTLDLPTTATVPIPLTLTHCHSPSQCPLPLRKWQVSASLTCF